MKKEEIYNEKIAPLVEKIFEICKENDIQMISSFNFGGTENGDKICNTYVNSEEESDGIVDALKILQYEYIAIPKHAGRLLGYLINEEDDLINL